MIREKRGRIQADRFLNVLGLEMAGDEEDKER